MTLRALTLTQPWASLVAIGAKSIETRSWGTSYRGPLAIHASKRFPVEDRDLFQEEPFWSALRRPDPRYPGSPRFEDWYSLPIGAIVAVANLHRVERIHVNGDGRSGLARSEILVGEPELSFGDYLPGRFGWVLSNVHPLPEPVPCRGALGLWRVPDPVLAEIEPVAARLGWRR